MAEVTNELIYEVLKSKQFRLTNIEDAVGGVDTRLTSLSEQLRGLSMSVNAGHTDIANIYNLLSGMNGRLVRIERRLDIVEEPAE